MLHDIVFGNDFLDMIPKAQATKENIDKLDFTKVKTFVHQGDTINRVKRQTTKWEKTFANHMSHKRLIPEYIKNSSNSKTK